MSELLRIEDLRVSFATDAGRSVAVDGVSLTVAPGEVLALVGESGSGKTVTARAVLGLLPSTATATGRVLLGGGPPEPARDRGGDSGRDGRDGRDTDGGPQEGDGAPAEDVLTASPARLRALRGSHAAMVFQEPSTALNPVFTIGWQLAEGLRAHGHGTRASRRAEAIEMLGKVGIPDPATRVDHYPHQLSGGQQQRAVIAMALALGTRLIVADEPTTALDVTVQAEILDLLHRCRTDFGTAILLITHNMGVVADLADRVAVMRTGRIVEQAPVRELFAAPRHPYTRELLAAVPDFGSGRTGGPRPAADGATEAVVSARGLVVDFAGRFGAKPFRAVDGVSFEIAAGEVLGLVGESGSGKTTISRTVAGLTPVSGGELTVLGEVVPVSRRARRAHLGSRAGQIGFVFQDPATSFNPLLTIGDCVAEPLYVHRRELGRQAIRARAAELLESVHLPRGYADRYPHELSGGQRQRAGLARALALRPRLLIADEPTSALDVSVQAKVLELFAELQAELGFAALFVSHDLAVVEQVADRVAVLHRGRLVETGPTASVLGSPHDPYTRRLIASLPVPDPVRQARRRPAPDAPPGAAPVPPPQPTGGTSR